MLDLVHLSRPPLLPLGGIKLCRQIALLTDMKEGDEVLVVPSGLAVTLEHFVREYQVQGSGVEDDLILLDDAEERLRGIGMLDRVHVQPGEMDGLPFRDGIFDVVIAELGLTARVSPESAVREIVRVAKEGASVVLVQPDWKAPVDPVRREILSQSLGCRPLMLVEWKRLLMDAGIERSHTEDWSDEETAFRPQITKPFPDFTELFSVSEKLGILRRARRRWGWGGVWAAWSREREVHKLLTQERVLGLDLVMGVKRVVGPPARGGAASEAPGRKDTPEALGGGDASEAPEAEDASEAPEGDASDALEGDASDALEGDDVSADGATEGGQLTGLPLFGDKGETPR